MSFTAIITADAKGFEKAIDQAQAKIDGLEKTVGQRLSSIGDKFTDIGRKASVLSAAIVAAGGASFKMAADFQDALGATDQVFKDASGSVQAWANNLDTSYGIAKKEALEYSNLMGSMLVNIGKLTEEQAAKQSAKLIELAGDLTAMYGGTTQDAVRALTGALKGNNTMLDNYGMAVNDALVKQKALELGLASGTGELSLQAKQAATLALIWEQTGAAQGQAGREADGASGSMRALQVEVKNLATSFGEILLPIITPIVSGIADMVNKIGSLSPELQKTIVVIGGIAAAIGPLMLGLGSLLKLAPLIGAAFTAMTGPIGIAVAAIAALTTGIIALTNRQKEAENAAEALAIINNTVTNEISREIAKVNILLKIAKDETKSKEERRKAIEKLNTISPEYLGFIELETINTNAAKNAIDGYTKSLKEKARQQAISEKISKLEAKRIDIEVKLIKEQEKVYSTAAKISGANKESQIGYYNDLIANIDKQISIYQSLGSASEESYDATKKAAEEAAAAARKAVEEETEAAKKIADESINVSDTFTKLIGTNLSLQDSIRKTSDTIDELQSKLIKLQTGIISSTNVRDEIKTTQQQINDLSEALNLLTGDRELDLKVNVEMPTIAADMNKFFDGKNWTLPAIDSSLLQTSLAKAGEMVIDYGRYIEGGIVDVVSAIGSAWGSGDWSNLGKDMLSAVGKLAQQFGAMVISFAIAADALKKIITTNPIAAIAAGAALIALGAAAQAAAGKMMNNAFSGSSGGYDRSYSGGTSSYQQATPSYAPTEFRGPYQENYTVEFKIGTNELVGVLDMAEQKKRRL